ncbi:MAG: aminoacyl-tRNA hydrolase [Pseudomonadales bacterium]
MAALQLIAGLGNPGPEYVDTRHNAGVWFVDELARRSGVVLQADKKLKGATATMRLAGHTVRLLVPDTFMNLSGQSVAACANFYKIPVESILVVHDELDLPLGTAKLKQGGGHGGNNGVRNIMQQLGNNGSFMRLRLGIGHPRELAPKRDVTSHVLGKPSSTERNLIEDCIDVGLKSLDLIAEDQWQRAQTLMHNHKPAE